LRPPPEKPITPRHTAKTAEKLASRRETGSEGGRYAGDVADERSGGVLKRALHRLTSTQEAHQADELQRDVVKTGCQAIADARDRSYVRLAGTVNTVTLRPRGGIPALEAELYDGSGAVTLIWLGRRRIAGVEPGRAMVVEGRLTTQRDVPVLFNPRYELRT
jgi:hypothetical protein